MEFPAVGYRNTSGSLNNPGNEGDYWSSVANGSNNAYKLNFNSGNLNVNNNNKQNGFSVRCVRQEFTALIFKISQCKASLARLNVNTCLFRASVLEFPAVGYRNNSDGSLNNAGTNGNYWSSVANSSDNAYNMYFNSSNLNVNNNNKQNGRSVRCVRQEFATLVFCV